MGGIEGSLLLYSHRHVGDFFCAAAAVPGEIAPRGEAARRLRYALKGGAPMQGIYDAVVIGSGFGGASPLVAWPSLAVPSACSSAAGAGVRRTSLARSARSVGPSGTRRTRASSTTAAFAPSMSY